MSLASGIIRHHFEPGELYLEQARYREALGEFQRVVTLPVLLASDSRTQLSAAELIKNLNEE